MNVKTAALAVLLGGLTASGVLVAGQESTRKPTTATPPLMVQPPVARPVVYQKQRDLLSVNVDGLPLRELLWEVMRQTGLEVRLDPAVDAKATAYFADLSLEEGLQRITGKLNTIKEYKQVGAGAKARKILVSVVILPPGQTDTKRAVRVMDFEKEVVLRADQVAKSRVAKTSSAADERWLGRLERVPSAQRQDYERQLSAQEREERKVQARKERAEAERQQRRAKVAAKDALYQQRKAASEAGRPPRSISPAVIKDLRGQLEQPPQTPEAIVPK